MNYHKLNLKNAKIYLLQFISSELSSQSGSKSQVQYDGMHFPLSHWNEFGPHETLVHLT